MQESKHYLLETVMAGKVRTEQDSSESFFSDTNQD